MMRYLSWTDFKDAVHKIGVFAIEQEATAVTGIPRGGLVVAVALSHEVGLPLALPVPGAALGASWLVVDDIADSGRTLMHYRNHKLKACWFKRWSCRLHVWAAETEMSDDWLVFPWENKKAAEADHAAYKASHATAQ